RSTDGGDTWVLLDTRDVQGSARFSVAFDPANSNHIIGFHQFQGLKESNDGGIAWTAVTPAWPTDMATGQPYVVTAAGVAPGSPPSLLVGTTKGVFRLDSTSGVWNQVLTGTDTTVSNPTAGSILVNTADVIRFVSVTVPAAASFVATVSDILRSD